MTVLMEMLSIFAMQYKEDNIYKYIYIYIYGILIYIYFVNMDDMDWGTAVR